MRIIAGSLGGRTFDAPRGHRTHPMGDKIRGALFNILGDITGLTLLDAFAGSGAISFEALSRGARDIVAIDVDKEAYETIRRNAETLGVKDDIIILRKNVGGWVRNNRDRQFDIVVADPPYNDIRPTILLRLVDVVAPDGILVVSWPGSEPVRQFAGVELLSSKSYGDAQLVFYRRTA